MLPCSSASAKYKPYDHTTHRMDVAEDLGIVEPMKAIKMKWTENILQQVNDMDDVISDIADTPEVKL